MTLCPLFESITFTGSPSAHDEAMFVAGVYEAQKVLPREAIEAAIDALSNSGYWYPHGIYIEQLRALLPKE